MLRDADRSSNVGHATRKSTSHFGSFVLIFDALVAGQVRRNPLGALLTAGAIAFGVASCVAANLTNAYADRAIKASVLGASEHADLQIVGVEGRLRPSILRLVRVVPGVNEARPVLEGSVTLRARASEITVHMQGLDALQTFAGSSTLRSYDPGPFAPPGPFEATMLEHSGVIVSQSVARRLALVTGDKVDAVLKDSSRMPLTVASILNTRSSQLDADTVLVDTNTAANVFGSSGALDRIDVVIDESALSAVRARIARVLPRDAHVEATAERIASLERLTYGFRFNLSVLSFVALALAAVLVTNSVSISVRQRRPEIAILRSLGASRGQIARAFLAEGALLGTFGGILGAILGDAFAQSLGGFAVPNSLIETGSQLASDTSVLIGTIGVGILMSVCAAVAPSIEAASVLPANALRVTPNLSTGKTKDTSARGLALALVSASIGSCSASGWRSVFAYASALGVLLGVSFCVPFWLSAGVRAGSSIASRSVPGGLAIARLRAHATRLSLIVITLFIAVCINIGLATATESFEQTIHIWEMNDRPGDFTVRLLDNHREDLPRLLTERIARLPGVAESALAGSGAPRPHSASIVVTARTGYSPDEMRRSIIAATAPFAVDVVSSRESRAAEETLFAPSLSLGRVVGRGSVGIAVVSAIATMIALLSEQRRELLLLAILGLAKAPMRKMIVYEAAVLSAFGALAGVVTGLGLGTLLVLVIDPLVSGYRAAFELPLDTAIVTPVVVVAAAMLAATVPAHLATSGLAIRALQST